MIIKSLPSGWIKRKWREVIPIMARLQRLLFLSLNIKYSLHARMLLTYSLFSLLGSHLACNIYYISLCGFCAPIAIDLFKKRSNVPTRGRPPSLKRKEKKSSP